MKKRCFALLLALGLAVSLTGCFDRTRDAADAPSPNAPPPSQTPAQEQTSTPESLPGTPENTHTPEEWDEAAGQLWEVTADGGLAPEDAAQSLAEQVAEHYRDLPDWVYWKPADFRAADLDVFDVYYGEPQSFCVNMDFYLKMPEGDCGSGWDFWEWHDSFEPVQEEGYTGYYRDGWEVLVKKNADGDWYVADRGTGGYSVELPPYTYSSGVENYIGNASMEKLTELFFLTEGVTHEYRLPMFLCQRPAEELTGLNDLLSQRMPEEGQALCRALSAYLNAGYGAQYEDSTLTSVDQLNELLDPAYWTWTQDVPPLEL